MSSPFAVPIIILILILKPLTGMTSTPVIIFYRGVPGPYPGPYCCSSGKWQWKIICGTNWKSTCPGWRHRAFLKSCTCTLYSLLTKSLVRLLHSLFISGVDYVHNTMAFFIILKSINKKYLKLLLANISNSLTKILHEWIVFCHLVK